MNYRNFGKTGWQVSEISRGRASNIAEIEDVAKASDMDPLSQELIDQYNTGE